MRTTIEHYCKKYNVDRARFSGMLEVYEHVKANLVCGQELITLFAVPDGIETSLYELIRQLRYI